MKNREVAELLNKIADYLELKEDAFRVRAYRKAALVIDGLSEDIAEIAKKGPEALEELPGIGEGIAGKIMDFLEHGKSKALEELKKKTPINMEELGEIGGVGPKTILKLYRKLSVKNVKDLEKAAKQGRIREIGGLGPTVEKNILKSIEFSKRSKGRALLGYALPLAEQIAEALRQLREVKRVDVGGSLRRRKETIGDIDILATSNAPEKVIDFFTKMPDVRQVLAKGPTKSSIRIEDVQADLRVLPDNIYGAALLYFTGNQQHNIGLRKIAIQKGMKLSEYGLFDKRTNRLLAGKTEEEVYKKLGMDYIEPEMREDEGEIQAAMQHRLPKLIGYGDIKGDLQMHTRWSDGSNTIEEMALAAKELGYEYIAITDHGGHLAIARALDEKRINGQRKEIDAANKKFKNFVVLQGIEVDIKADGNLDLSDSILKKLDVVVASVHSGFKTPKEKMTKRVIKAMENEHVDIIAHPTGRLIQKREPFEIDLDAVFDKAKETGTILEVNAYPERLDLKDVHVKAAVKAGVKLAISTDAHQSDQLGFMRFGIATARRGWVQKKDVINANSLKEMLKLLK
ncbi:DNA polymerase/3'-5' exonuclease PolX [Candidatus Woesearchaeota archaeon]|nr:DNA polymerase/3'-5' exonuclease PolX [Candidatus Woesearchaeota archaeon]